MYFTDIFWYICISLLQFPPLTVQFCLPHHLGRDGTGEIMTVGGFRNKYLGVSCWCILVWFLIYFILLMYFDIFVASVAVVRYQSCCRTPNQFFSSSSVKTARWWRTLENLVSRPASEVGGFGRKKLKFGEAQPKLCFGSDIASQQGFGEKIKVHRVLTKKIETRRGAAELTFNF